MLVARLMCELKRTVATVSNTTSQVTRYRQYFVATQLVSILFLLAHIHYIVLYFAVKKKHAQMVPDKVQARVYYRVVGQVYTYLVVV